MVMPGGQGCAAPDRGVDFAGKKPFQDPEVHCWRGVVPKAMGCGLRRWRRLGSHRRSLTDQRGVALIEFALVLPMILLILLGMIDVGKAVNYWNDETHLANEAARYAAVNKSPVSTQKINQAVRDQADSSELKKGGTSSVSAPGLRICIWFPENHHKYADPNVRDHDIGDPVQVVVHAQYNWLAYLVGQGLPLHSDLAATSTMRLEQTYHANGNPAADAFWTGPASAPDWHAKGTC
jgi:Flp pilus assembly protein TadG